MLKLKAHTALVTPFDQRAWFATAAAMGRACERIIYETHGFDKMLLKMFNSKFMLHMITGLMCCFFTGVSLPNSMAYLKKTQLILIRPSA